MKLYIKALLTLGSLLSIYRACDIGCLRCNSSDNTCVVCDFQNSYLPSSGGCTQTTLTGCSIVSTVAGCLACNVDKYLNTDTGLCTSLTTKITNCWKYSGPSTCSACTSGYYLSNNACLKSSTIANCSVYANATTCSQCRDGYVPNVAKTSCISVNTTTCSNYQNYFCNKCDASALSNNNAYLINNFDSQNASAIRGIVSTINLSSNFNLVQSLCLTTTVTNCSIFSLYNKCKVCNSGYYLTSNFKCALYIGNGLSGCEYYGNGQICLSCLNGYYLQGPICSASTLIDNCENYSAIENVCSSCASGYYLLDNACTVRLNVDGNCTEYDSNADKCLKCNADFYLYNNGIACVAYQNNCVEFTNYDLAGVSSVCMKCNTGYYLQNSACVQGHDANCSAYTNNEDTCIECGDSYLLDDNTNTCVTFNSTIAFCLAYAGNLPVRCTTCDYKSAKFYQNAICELKDLIDNCVQFSDIHTCSKCDAGYVLNNNACDLIDESEHCNHKDAGVCSQCISGYDLVNNLCVAVSSAYTTNCGYTDSLLEGITYQCKGCSTGAIPIDNIEDICLELALQTFPLIDNCQKYYNNNGTYKCMYCSSAFSLSVNGLECLETCPTGEVSYYGALASINTDVLVSVLAHCLDLSNFDDLPDGCAVASHNLKGSGNVCLECGDGYIPIESCPLNNTFFNISDLSVISEGQAFSTLSCVLQTGASVFFPSSSVPDANCQHYHPIGDNYYCSQCKFGQTGVINVESADNYYIDCSNTVANCDTSVRLGSGFTDDSWLADMYGFSLSSEYTCHVCSNDGEIPFIHLDNRGNLMSYQVNDTDLIPSDASVKDGEFTVCRLPTKEGLNIPDANFTSFVDNCALGLYVVDIPKNTETDLPSIRCIACKDGYKRTIDATGFYIESCTAIPNCDSQPASGWFEGCKNCDSTHVKIIDADGKIDANSCATEATAPNCRIYNNETSKCAHCERGYYLDVDGNCLLLNITACPNYAQRSNLTFTLSDNSDNYSYAYYFGGQGFDCTSCDVDFVSVQVTDHAPLCSIFGDIANSNTSYLADNCASYYINADGVVICHQCKGEYIISDDGSFCASDASLIGCNLVNGDSECIQCGVEYLISGNDCLALNISGCSDYEVAGGALSCVTCAEGNILDSNTCSVGLIPHCAEYTDATTCGSCVTDFYLWNNVCVAMPSYITCNRATIAENSTDFNCYQCGSDYILNDGVTSTDYPICLEFNPIEFCIEYDENYDCISCDTNYYLNSNKCSLISHIDNCESYKAAASGCAQCNPFFYYKSNVATCIGVTGVIPYCYLYDSSKNCLICGRNRYLNNNECLEVTSKISNCHYYTDASSCLTCNDGYTLIAGACVEIIALNCLTYSSDSTCGTCPDKYYLKVRSGAAKFTRDCIEAAIDNCIEVNFASGACKTCDKGYIPSAKTCITNNNVITNCKSQKTTLVCDVCNQGYIKSTDGTSCVLETSIRNLETKCTDLRYNSSPSCSSCKFGYYFNSSTCVACSLNKLSDGCMFCNPNDNSICLVCLKNYHMDVSGLCISNTSGLEAEDVDVDDSDESVRIFGTIGLILSVVFALLM